MSCPTPPQISNKSHWRTAIEKQDDNLWNSQVNDLNASTAHSFILTLITHYSTISFTLLSPGTTILSHLYLS